LKSCRLKLQCWVPRAEFWIYLWWAGLYEPSHNEERFRGLCELAMLSVEFVAVLLDRTPSLSQAFKNLFATSIECSKRQGSCRTRQDLKDGDCLRVDQVPRSVWHRTKQSKIAELTGNDTCYTCSERQWTIMCYKLCSIATIFSVYRHDSSKSVSTFKCSK
jgi:hypothetical protein